MKQRNRIIIALFLIGIVLSCIMLQERQKQYQREEAYNQEQQEVTTHDLQSILPYKNKYMGNASNNIGLFSNLPLSDFNRKYSQDPETFTFEIDFQGDSTQIESIRLKKEIIYSAVSAFALIENLQTVKYHYTDTIYTVNRASIEKQYGDLQSLLNESSWRSMQEKLKDSGYVEDLLRKITE
jgi:hypothetical protein